MAGFVLPGGVVDLLRRLRELDQESADLERERFDLVRLLLANTEARERVESERERLERGDRDG